MAEFAGYNGNFKLHASLSQSHSAVVTVVGGINTWTVNYAGEAHEVTDFANAGVKAYVAGGTGWNGTATGYYSSAVSYNATYKPGTDFTMKAGLSASSTNYCLGNIIITGIGFGTAVDGAITVNFDFQGNGALTIV